MYFDFHIYAKMVRLAFREKNPTGRRRLFFVVFFLIPIVSTFHAICFFLDVLLFPGLRKVKVHEPVFILGHGRSGTTLMHRLMSKDGDRFSYFMLYEMFFPSLLQRKVIRTIAEWDRRWWGARLEKRMQALDDRLFGAMRDAHPTGFTAPEEDDDILTFSCASGVWITLFPYMGELDFFYVDEWPEKRRRGMMRYYKECIRRQLYLNGPHKTHLSKNPTFAGRMETLLETFPDARIALMLRNPYETIPSLLKLLQGSWKRHRWSREEMERSLRLIAETSFDTYRYPLEVLDRHPEVPRAFVAYAALVDHPHSTVTQAYEQLGLAMTPEFDAVLQAEEKRTRSHETTHRYSLEEFGLRADAIRTELSGVFARFGWEEEPGSAADASHAAKERAVHTEGTS